MMIGALAIAAHSQQPRVGQTNDPEQLRRAASAYYNIGWAEFGRGNIASAIEKYLESKRLFEEAHARRDLIYILADLGSLYIYSSDYKTSKVYSEQSLALAEALKDSSESAGAWPDDYGIGTALSNLGNVSRHDGEHDKAIEYFKKSLAAYQRIDNGTGKFKVEILDDLADIGRTYLARGDSLRALNYLNQAMGLAKESDREAGICNSIGILYTNQRDYGYWAYKTIETLPDGDTICYPIRGIRLDPGALRADLDALEAARWANQDRYQAARTNWTGIALYSISGAQGAQALRIRALQMGHGEDRISPFET